MYRNDQLDGTMTRWYVSGVKETEENYRHGQKSGKSCTWDENGNLIEERNYLKDTLDGDYRLYYPTGIVNIEGKYRNGLYHGKWQYFAATGAKVGEGNFVDGTGLLVGLDNRGRKNHEVHYERNRKNGVEAEYNSDGSVKWSRMYMNDKLIRQEGDTLAH
jgi:antitoxin component YwqK of YwqJK toxin-antitoxin module